MTQDGGSDQPTTLNLSSSTGPDETSTFNLWNSSTDVSHFPATSSLPQHTDCNVRLKTSDSLDLPTNDTSSRFSTVSCFYGGAEHSDSPFPSAAATAGRFPWKKNGKYEVRDNNLLAASGDGSEDLDSVDGSLLAVNRPVKRPSRERFNEFLAPPASRRKSRAGRKPLSGVFGICRQDSRWVVSYKDDNGITRHRYFFFYQDDETMQQLSQAKRFLWKVVRLGRKLNPRDGEGLEEFVRNYESDGEPDSSD